MGTIARTPHGLGGRSVALMIAVTIALVAAAAATGLFTRRAAAVPSPERTAQLARGSVGRAVTPATDATTPQQVTVGFYAMSLQGFDQEDNSYYADFYMWLRWKGEHDPTASLELTNNIERWGLTMTPVYEEPKELPTGELIQQFHVQGRFFQPLDMSDYPLDEHQLTVQIEDTQFAEDQVVYVADTEDSGIDAGFRIPGWSITDWSVPITSHQYDTSFGEGKIAEAAHTYSAAAFALDIERPRTFFLWKLLLPLIIVLLLAGSVLFVHPTLTEVRLAAPATALLSLVFLQQSYSDTLPATGTLVLLDQIYALAYGLIIMLILTTTLTSHWMRVETDESTARALRLDHVAAVAMVGIFLLGSLAVIWAH